MKQPLIARSSWRRQIGRFAAAAGFSWMMMVVVAWHVVGCSSGAAKALHRHAALEWQWRHEMPNWSAADWNAWEAELAAALNLPTPEPPMFPDADDDNNGDAKGGADDEHTAN